MTSYLDNSYDYYYYVTNIFGSFEIFWPILYSYQVSLFSDANWQS